MLMMTLTFLAGVAIACAFRIWMAIGAGFLLIIGGVLWQFAQEKPIFHALIEIAFQSLALQTGYFFGLIFDHLFAQPLRHKAIGFDLVSRFRHQLRIIGLRTR